jgi:hypothetical protein
MPRQFDHEKLNVCHTTLRFVVWITGVLERVPKNLAVHSQLDGASTSMPLNIACRLREEPDGFAETADAEYGKGNE